MVRPGALLRACIVHRHLSLADTYRYRLCTARCPAGLSAMALIPAARRPVCDTAAMGHRTNALSREFVAARAVPWGGVVTI